MDAMIGSAILLGFWFASYCKKYNPNHGQYHTNMP